MGDLPFLQTGTVSHTYTQVSPPLCMAACLSPDPLAQCLMFLLLPDMHMAILLHRVAPNLRTYTEARMDASLQSPSLWPP